MSRRHRAEKREILPDAKFGDRVLTKFMNSLMVHGKKSVAEKTLYGALDQVEEKARQDPVQTFHQALENVKPAIEVRSRRVGGATYQVPIEVRADRSQALAIRWLIVGIRYKSFRLCLHIRSSSIEDKTNTAARSRFKKVPSYNP